MQRNRSDSWNWKLSTAALLLVIGMCNSRLAIAIPPVSTAELEHWSRRSVPFPGEWGTHSTASIIAQLPPIIEGTSDSELMYMISTIGVRAPHRRLQQLVSVTTNPQTSAVLKVAQTSSWPPSAEAGDTLVPLLDDNLPPAVQGIILESIMRRRNPTHEKQIRAHLQPLLDDRSTSLAQVRAESLSLQLEHYLSHLRSLKRKQFHRTSIWLTLVTAMVTCGIGMFWLFRQIKA